MTTVVVMQPYFIPYAGYFRLFAAADVFVAFDCVQFPRRGWVHRNRLPVATETTDWLTLPVEKCTRDTRIDNLKFAPDARTILARNVQRFPILRSAWKNASPLLNLVTDIGSGSVADYLCSQLAQLTAMLGISRPVVRSSTLGIPANVHGQDRVIAAATALGATCYVNSPGGREIYDPKAFAEHAIALKFLAPFAGPTESILGLLLTRPAGEIAGMIRSQTILCS
jgi:hypothetical protein